MASPLPRHVAQISTLVNGAGQGTPGIARARSNAIELVEERLALLAAEGLDTTMWDTLYAGCAYSRSVGDRAAASDWAGRAAENARLALGKDSDEYQKYAALVGSRKADKKGGKKK